MSFGINDTRVIALKYCYIIDMGENIYSNSRISYEYFCFLGCTQVIEGLESLRTNKLYIYTAPCNAAMYLFIEIYIDILSLALAALRVHR